MLHSVARGGCGWSVARFPGNTASIAVLLAVWFLAVTRTTAQSLSPTDDHRPLAVEVPDASTFTVRMPEGDLPIQGVSNRPLRIERPYESGFTIGSPQGDLPIRQKADAVLLITAIRDEDVVNRMPKGGLPVAEDTVDAPLRIAMPDATNDAFRMPDDDLPLSSPPEEFPPIGIEKDEYGIALAEQSPRLAPDTHLMSHASETIGSETMVGPWEGPWLDDWPEGHSTESHRTESHPVVMTAHETPVENEAGDAHGVDGVPAWCWDHFWCPRPDMYQRHSYFPDSHGRYYMHNYNPMHIAVHQEFVTSFGGDPRHPYSHEVFKEIEEEQKAETPEELPPQPQQNDTETTSAPSQGRSPKRSGIRR